MYQKHRCERIFDGHIMLNPAENVSDASIYQHRLLHIGFYKANTFCSVNLTKSRGFKQFIAAVYEKMSLIYVKYT